MSAAISINQLDQVQLSEPHQRLLRSADVAPGVLVPAVHTRLLTEARDLLAVAQVVGSERLQVHWLEVAPDGVRALVTLGDVTVPVLSPQGDLAIEIGADLGLMWPIDAIRTPLPGYAFVHVRNRAVWHPNASIATDGKPCALCLGARMPRGVPLVRGVLLGAWGLLTLQTPPAIDLLDPAGVLNARAAVFYRDWLVANRHRVPLTNVPFMRAHPAKEMQ